jgi:hypothetical protein
MDRFRPDNTEGYSQEDLAALNAAFEFVMRHHPSIDHRTDTVEFAMWQDDVASLLLERYDAGERGEELIL